MEILSISNPVRTAAGGVDLILGTEEYGVIPFHAVGTDPVGSDSYQLYNRAIAGEFGVVAPYSPPVLTPEQKKKIMADMVQAHLDATAQVYGFDDIRNAVSYADEPAVPSFQTHGLSLRAWRSLVWQKCYAVLAQVEAGEIVEPSGAELMAMLPTLNIGV